MPTAPTTTANPTPTTYANTQGYTATPNANATPAQIAAGQSYLSSKGFASTGSYSPPPPVSNTIDGSSLGSQNPITAPSYTPPAGSNAFVQSLNPIPQGTQTEESTATPGGEGSTTTTDPFKKQFSDYYGGLISKLGLEGTEYQNLQAQYQVPQITQNLANIRGTIAQRTAGYAAQWQLANTEHAALPYIAGEQTQIQRTQAVELGMLTAQEQALAGNLQAANDIVDRTIQHEFDPIKNQLQASAQWFQMHQNDLSASEQKKYELNNSLTTMSAQNLYSTKSDAAKTAIQYGASPSTMSAIANAKSTTDVYNALSGLTTGGSGLGSVVNGYDLSTYATDPNYGIPKSIFLWIYKDQTSINYRIH